MTCYQQEQQEQEEETLQLMQLQERGCYSTTSSTTISMMSQYHPKLINWFRTMTEWCISVAECCHMSMETIEIAMNLLHRYTTIIMTMDVENVDDSTFTSCKMSAPQFQLATMTCLYIASKLSSPKAALTPAQLEKLGRQQSNLKAVDIEDMERSILHLLKWKVHPPTSFAFYQQYNYCYNNNKSRVFSKQEQEMMDYLVQVQIQQSLKELHWMRVSPSVIALAAMQNAMDLLQQQQSEQQPEKSMVLAGKDQSVLVTRLQNRLAPVAWNAYYYYYGAPSTSPISSSSLSEQEQEENKHKSTDESNGNTPCNHHERKIYRRQISPTSIIVVAEP